MTESCDEDEVMRRLRAGVAEAGSARAWAERAGVTRQYLSDVLLGRRSPGDGILRGLGLQRSEPRYEPRAPEEIALYDADGVSLVVATREFD